MPNSEVPSHMAEVRTDRPPCIYFDTNVFRYFAAVFRNQPIEENLRQYFAISPISLLELLSQLATPGADEAFLAVRTLLNVFDPTRTAVLPWVNEALLVAVFGLQSTKGEMTELLERATQNVLNAENATEVASDAKQLRGHLNTAKKQIAQNFSRVLETSRTEGELESAEHRRIFASGMASRAKVDRESVDTDMVVGKLDALWMFELERLKIAVPDADYNPFSKKRLNDGFDSEQLIYLASPEMHFLTADGGFNRAAHSSQHSRIHYHPAQTYQDRSSALRIIRGIVENGAK